MSDVHFYETRMGVKFYEHTVPELVRQLAKLNETLTRLAVRLEIGTELASPGDSEVEGDL